MPHPTDAIPKPVNNPPSMGGYRWEVPDAVLPVVNGRPARAAVVVEAVSPSAAIAASMLAPDTVVPEADRREAGWSVLQRKVGAKATPPVQTPAALDLTTDPLKDSVVTQNVKEMIAFRVWVDLGAGRSFEALSRALTDMAERPGSSTPKALANLSPDVLARWAKAGDWRNKLTEYQKVMWTKMHGSAAADVAVIMSRYRTVANEEMARIQRRQRDDPSFMLVKNTGDLAKLLEIIKQVFNPATVTDIVGGLKEVDDEDHQLSSVFYAAADMKRDELMGDLLDVAEEVERGLMAMDGAE